MAKVDSVTICHPKCCQNLVTLAPIMASLIVVICFVTLSTLNPIDSWSLTGVLQSPDLTKDRSSNSPPGARLLDHRFTRYENLFNDDNNASLYLPRFDLGRRNDEVAASTTTLPPATNNTNGRSLDLNVLLGSSSSESGESQEGRIVNDKPKMDIQGFIPIISLAKPQQQQHHMIPKPHYPYSGMESMHQNHHSIYPNPSMEQAKSNAFAGGIGGIHAAIQNLAAPFKLRRRGQEMIPGQDCLCVPFYMCAKGYLETTAKNAIGSSSFASPATSPNKEYFEQQLAAAQSEIASSIPAQFNPFTQGSHPITTQTQPIYQGNSQSSQIAPQGSYDSATLPLDERSVDGQEQGRSTHFPSNGTDADEASGRMIGGNACGLMRTCCRFAPELPTGPQSPYTAASFASHEVQNNPHHQVGQFPGVFHGQQGVNPYFRPPPPPVHPMIAKRPTFSMPQGSFEILGASLIKPKPQGFSPPQFGPVITPMNPYLQKPFVKPPQRLYQPSPVHQGHRQGYSMGHSSAMASLPVPSYSNNHLGNSANFYGQCGVRSYSGTQGRVQNLQYHESSADFGEYPWQAALLKRLGPADSLYVCGGVLISPNFILTAAHCIKENRAEDLKVRLGEWDVHREDEFYPYVERMVQEVVIHPDFFQGNLINDIALIRMDSSVELSNPHILPACMPDPFESFVGHRCWVTGWGKNAFGHQGEYQSVLKEVDLPVVSNGECEHNLRRTRLGPYYQLHHGFMCAGGERGKDACEGDGGSPLVCDVNGHWKVAGLVSWGIGCGQPGIPGVYANVAYYRQWIDSIISRYGRALDSSESSSSYASSGIIQERSNDGNETIISAIPSLSVEVTTLSAPIANSTTEANNSNESLSREA